jgi:hypothetical protein
LLGAADALPSEPEEPEEQAARERARGSAATANAARVAARDGRRIWILAWNAIDEIGCGNCEVGGQVNLRNSRPRSDLRSPKGRSRYLAGSGILQ